MCGIINIELDLLKFITDSWRGLSQELGYLRYPEHRITQLTEAMAHLRSKAEDIRNRIRSAERSGETQTEEVTDWLKKVEAIDKEVSKIKTDRENGNFRWSINHRAERSLAKVSALDNLSRFDIVATRRPQKGVKEVPAELSPVNPTMTSYLSKLQDFLQDDGSRIFGIWGMGGVGKTTLLLKLNELLCSSKAGQTAPMFEHVIWVVASKDYNLRKLQQEISKCLGLTPREDRISPTVEIRDYLEDKSFLLLLDDIWQTVELSELGIPQLTRNRTKKQKVVFTTRLQRVCGQMQARPMMNIECLNEEEAWLLFQNKAGEETLQAHPMILEYAREVAKECDGLPLALVVIGSAMIMKKTPEEWRNAITLLKKSRPHEIEGMDDKILAKLKFSYDHLAHDNLRKCFLLCSLWPEDHSISKTDLIECWMGHDLVDERKFDNINEAYDSGYDLIGVLQAACLLESGDGADEKVKMHDVVRDLALWIASDCGERHNKFIVTSGVTTSMDSMREVEKMALFRRDVSHTIRFPSNLFKLETLMLLRCYSSFKFTLNEIFQRTHALTYLDLSNSDINKLPKQIGLLGNLRYLNISKTKIRLLPVQLSNLRELTFLLLRDLNSIIIPSGVLEMLDMLSLIDMTGTLCDNWKEISRMHHGLKGVGITLESIEDLHQLVKLPNILIWRLELNGLVEFNEPLQLLSPLLLGSRNIHSDIQMLTIKGCRSLEVVLMACDGLDNNFSLLRLKKVELFNLPTLKEIVWRGVCPVKMLPSLTRLTIHNCRKLRNLSWVIRLKSLKYLDVAMCTEMEQIINVDNDGEEENDIGLTDLAFPSLMDIYLSGLESLRVFGGSFKFPSLEFMRVKYCPNLHALPFGKEIAVRKLKKIEGNNEWWDNLDIRDDDRAVLLPYFKKVPNYDVIIQVQQDITTTSVHYL